MSEENKNVVRNFVDETWGNGRMEVSTVDKYCSADCVFHNLPPGMEGREGYKQFLNMFAAATSNRKSDLTPDLIAEGDMVVQRWSSTMNHSGDLMGLPATNKQFTVTGINIYRVAGGKIVEQWAETDIAGMMQQLGAMG
jgi:predicted ester cyclase